MKPILKVVAGLSIIVACLPSLAKSAPSRELKIDSILLETIDLTREVKTQTVRILKVCIDGHAYFLFAAKKPSVSMSSIAPVFKDSKPETCTK